MTIAYRVSRRRFREHGAVTLAPSALSSRKRTSEAVRWIVPYRGRRIGFPSGTVGAQWKTFGSSPCHREPTGRGAMIGAEAVARAPPTATAVKR